MRHNYVRYNNPLFQVTECEIFLSIIVKFLDADKPFWQRTVALEVLHQVCCPVYYIIC